VQLPVLNVPAGCLEARFEDKKPLYTSGEAAAEANRCLYCSDAPCVAACPTSIDIPSFIHKISTGNVRGAARTILTANLLGQSCGQVCPVEVLCAGACVYNEWHREPIAIGRLQRYAVESALKANPRLFSAKPPTGKRVALVGAGPASIAAAGWLALEGHACVIFERQDLPGGLNSLGIAPYKMKVDEALRELSWVMKLGQIELRTGIEVVKTAKGPTQVATSALLSEFDAVFLGLGLGSDTKLGIPGEEGPGVHGAVALISELKSRPGFSLGQAKRAVVVGGGNTALDIAHELALLGLDVSMVYRRGRAEMSGYAHELSGALDHGVKFLEHLQPVEVLRAGPGGPVTGLVVSPTQASGAQARAPTEAGALQTLPADLIAVAIGQSRATEVARAFDGVQLDERGRVKVNPETHRTGHEKVWCGGDCVNGGKEVVNAVAEAKLAAKDIHRALCAPRGSHG
jgi:glutamate synthase (NADPH/NADH) small chain